MAVFKMDKNFDIILNKDAVKLVPELKSLSGDELKYVILVIDYVDGPYRKKPLEERKLMAKKNVYGDKTPPPLSIKKIIAGMNAYKSLVFDIRRETIDIYKAKVRTLQKETLNMELSFARMKEIDSTITFMQERISLMERDLDIEEGEELVLKGKKLLSYVEIWQRRQREYREFKENI